MPEHHRAVLLSAVRRLPVHTISSSNTTSQHSDDDTTPAWDAQQMDRLDWDTHNHRLCLHTTYGCVYTLLTSLTSPHVHSHWVSKLAGGSDYLAQGPGVNMFHQNHWLYWALDRSLPV